jgi:DNA mismatch endonuclease (patch repair protein)
VETADSTLRSRTMASVKSRQTTPEILVQESLSRLKYKFDVCCADLPGSPDVVVARRKQVIFVHGCFWHGHSCKRGSRVPEANREYWVSKIARNRARDQRAARKLRRMGLSVATLWECRLRDRQSLDLRLRKLLSKTTGGATRRPSVRKS